MADAGRLVILLGFVLLIVGAAMVVFGKLPLPGNFTFRRGNVTVFAPLGLMLLVSVVLTLVLNIVLRIGR